MRRISLALTLVGAVTAAGCGGAGNSSGSGTAKGIPGISFGVNVTGTTAGGKIESGTVDAGGVFTADGVIVCPGTCAATFPVADTVALKATANAPTATQPRFYFEGFAGDCSGTGICTLTAGADKFVSVVFTTSPSAHPNWSGVEYGVEAHKLNYRCQNCHGAALQGAGIVPACSKCHAGPYAFEVDGHFNSENEAWGPHGAVGQNSAWSTACLRCHTSDGYRDYIGELDGSSNSLTGNFLVSNPNPTVGDNASQPGAYKWGALGCNACHNDVSDPLSGTHFNAGNPAAPFDMETYFGINGPVPGVTAIGFPSLLQVSGVQKVTGLCGQCHQGRESTASIANKIAVNVASASRGLTYASVAAASYAPNPNPNTTTLLVGAKANLAANTYTGYTAIFNGASNKALNGLRRVVAAQTAGSATAPGTAWTITWDSALPSAPTCTVYVTSATPVCDGATLYPTVTSGTTDGSFTATLTDGSRAWTANQWTGFLVYFHTGGNQGRFAAITSNTATTLQLSDNAMAAPAAGDFYQIVPNAAAVLNAVPINASTGKPTISFTNPHYFGVAATLFGAKAAGWNQYPGLAYDGSFAHQNTNCTDCHGAHAGGSLGGFHVEAASCEACHGAGNDVIAKAGSVLYGDLDGDTNAAEGIEAEIAGLEATMYAALQRYSKAAGTDQLCYKDAYPYMYVDVDQDGVCEDDETTSYSRFTPRSLKAAFNLKWAHTESGAWAHNPKYAAQVLMDTIDDLKAGLTSLSVANADLVHGTRP